ncbi:polysaccharide lyase family 7 protein [Polaribacter sp. Hel1_85]|uniref:polysaccharide lyase family 7 protein n=1 Tax=Polaribacter sp. Hel1_85 TaxID=1250005 RepID=UPI00052E23FC|nr:polysaccharide lyase family 7 protein [Polaribacter sp. Hel1_85]KGL61810.1 alginate lyase domain protein [Polaribacter sp. Hel1_85]
MLKTYFKFIFIFFIILSCSSNETEKDVVIDDDTETTEEPVTTEKSVDFGKLVVETSWISEDTGDRDTFNASEVDNEAWMDVLDNDNVLMTCLAADSHRTELKENTGIESSLNTLKKMKYTATLTDIPSNGVTVAQIHNRGGVNRPWIRVYIDDDKYIKIKATETTPDESKSSYSTYVGPLYTAKNEFSINITTQNGVATFEIITAGITYSESLTPSSDWDNYQNSYYLKAGVYTEGDDVEPKLEMSAFSIEY